MIGINVLLRRMYGGDESVQAYTNALNKPLTRLWLGEDDALHLRFADGTGLRFRDEGQNCCEHRYMRTDDDLSHFVGATFTGAELKPVTTVPTESEWGSEHEVQFLEIHTDRGSFTMASHNEHNGYYGGFSLEVSAETDEEAVC